MHLISDKFKAKKGFDHPSNAEHFSIVEMGSKMYHALIGDGWKVLTPHDVATIQAGNGSEDDASEQPKDPSDKSDKGKAVDDSSVVVTDPKDVKDARVAKEDGAKAAAKTEVVAPGASVAGVNVAEAVARAKEQK